MSKSSLQPDPIVETPRLSLNRLTRSDAPFILELLTEPSFLRHIGDKGVRDLEGARDYIETGPRASYERHGFGLFRVDLETGTPIGICGLLQRDYLADPDIGFAFLPAYWGRGYAYESAAAVLEWGRASLGLERVVAIVAADNEPSMRLLEKLGLGCERTIRTPDDNEVVRLYSPQPAPPA